MSDRVRPCQTMSDHVRPCQLRGGQTVTDTGFPPPVLLFYPSSIIPAMIQNHFHLHFHLSEGQTAEAWEPSKKRGSLDRRELS
jgi:hypothetical protein